MTLRRWSAGATLVVGLANLAGGLAHVVGVTRTAMLRGGLFDTRHTVLLAVGWSLVGPALAMLAAVRPMGHGKRWAYPLAMLPASFLLVELVLLGSSLGTPGQYLPAWAAAVGYLALVGHAWRRER